VIALERLRYTYPESPRPALLDLDLTIAGGECVLVGGVSGSGKSTLLRAINGLVPHFYGGRFGGRAIVAGLDTRLARPQVLAAHVGTVFQDHPSRFLTASVEEEVAFSLEVAVSDPRRIPARVREVVDRLGVAELAGRQLDRLSAGEQARLAIAAAAARGPRILVLDEPVTHIDPSGAQAVVHWVEQMARQDGVTVVVAEHRSETWAQAVDRRVRLAPTGAIEDAAAERRAPEVEPSVWDHVAPPTSAGLRARGLQVAFNGRSVLRGIDLDLEPGEIVALVGRNGSGKTTLLRSLMGILPAQAGDVQVGRASIRGRPVRETARRIGYVPQAPSSMLFADTVADEIGLTLGQHGRAARSAVEPWLESFGLRGLADRYPRDLSAGERQRLALAVVLAAGRPILLLDEPTLGMDRPRLAWLGAMLDAFRRAGAAILLATHDAAFVADYATRAILLSGGRVAAQGTPVDVLDADPAFADALRRWRVEAMGEATTARVGHADDR